MDFIPRHRSIAGTAPLDNTSAHDSRPTREFIQEAITVLKNETPQGPSLTQIWDSIQAGVDNLHHRLTSLSSEVNNHISSTVDTAAALQQL